MIRSEVLPEHLFVNTDVHTLCKVSRMCAENLRVVFFSRLADHAWADSSLIRR